MPVQHAIWKVGPAPIPLPVSKLLTEQHLEDMIVAKPEILSKEWMLIGRQELTGFGGRIDLLAIAPDASLVLIELKRDKTPREIVAQALDYATWVERLTAEKISQIYRNFSHGGNLGTAFKDRFGIDLDEDTLNASHQILLVAAELDDSTERIISYLNARDIAINVLFFQVFQHGEDQFLSRTWFIDPGETQANVAVSTKSSGNKEPWNGEYYVSFGGDCTWEEAKAHGFISAGGGSWYTRTLKLLSPGNRVWVTIPNKGYVGVGIVTEATQTVHEFKIQTSEGDRLAVEVLSTADKLRARSTDPEMAEAFVRVKWLDTVQEAKAVKEVGFFGNQNTVCQPTAPKWRHTVERLKTFFPNWNAKNGS